MYTCVPEGHHHQHGGDKVDCLGPDHLHADSTGPLPKLLDAVVPIIPVPEGAGKVQVLQCMENLIGYVFLLSKVGGNASFQNKYYKELEKGQTNQSNKSLLQCE